MITKNTFSHRACPKVKFKNPDLNPANVLNSSDSLDGVVIIQHSDSILILQNDYNRYTWTDNYFCNYGNYFCLDAWAKTNDANNCIMFVAEYKHW